MTAAQEEAAKQYADECNDCWTNDYNGFLAGVQWRDENPGWLAYPENKPKDGQRVICYMHREYEKKREVGEAEFDAKYSVWHQYRGREDEDLEVFAFMPLPPSPTQQTK